MTDAGQVLQLPDGVNNGTVVYNDVSSQFQFIYVSADDEILSKVSDTANGSFEPGDVILEGAATGADKPFFVTDGEGHIGATPVSPIRSTAACTCRCNTAEIKKAL